ncbi:hypothetical protein [Actinoplanes awajinensis]|uniref:PKD domain-containing protein n=1 Tax=Actinoplanes awajinensis subsp. mycoplanecinus TaxID=135947 RepID=A0A117MPY8_9ACTN|nr:hypothetical protein [Actinoplanes awajinensis]KUL29336.1 hypothetical protein ADL15_28240 [Actinoplanes awajinensis subsp. mycoplanecinus]
MKPRLARPLLAAIVGGALAAGGAVAASPAFAVSSPVRAAVAVEESGEPTASAEPAPSDSVTSEPAPSDSASSEPAPSDSTSVEPAPSDSTSVEPSTPATSPSVSPSASTPAPDTIPPKGAYKLSATSIWTGQFVKFTQTSADFSDNVTPDAQIKRTVNWGDGTGLLTLTASQTVVQHNYNKPGTFTLVERLTDKAGKFSDIKKTVKVSNAATKLVNSKTSVWNGQRYYLTVKAVPAGTQYVVIQNGDNCTGEFKWTGKAKAVKMYFWKDCTTGKIVTGKRYAKVKYRNANGYSAWFTGGAGVTVKKDSWKPTVTVTKPKNSNKLSSWKYVTGTSKDKGSGVRVVWVSLENFSNGQDYCLNVNKKWQKVNGDTWNDVCYSWKATVSANGKWKFKVPAGLKKGLFWPAASAEDWAGRQTYPYKYIEAKITRS